MEGREPAQVGRGGLSGASSGPVLGRGLAAVGWDSGRVVPGDLLNPMSGWGCDDGTLGWTSWDFETTLGGIHTSQHCLFPSQTTHSKGHSPLACCPRASGCPVLLYTLWLSRLARSCGSGHAGTGLESVRYARSVVGQLGLARSRMLVAAVCGGRLAGTRVHTSSPSPSRYFFCNVSD